MALGIPDLGGRLDRVEANMAAIVTALKQTNEALTLVNQQLEQLVQLALIEAEVDLAEKT